MYVTHPCPRSSLQMHQPPMQLMLRRLMREDLESEVSLGYIVRPCCEKPKQISKRML